MRQAKPQRREGVGKEPPVSEAFTVLRLGFMAFSSRQLISINIHINQISFYRCTVTCPGVGTDGMGWDGMGWEQSSLCRNYEYLPNTAKFQRV